MPKKPVRTHTQLLAENEDLRTRLEAAEAALRAIRSGGVDALVVPGPGGDQIFTLRGADRAYRALIEEMSEGALTLTAEGVILYANRRLAEMLKTPLEKVIGSTIPTWIAPESQGVLQSLLRQGVNEKRREQLVFAGSDGTRVPVHLSVSSLPGNEMPDAFCLVATDLTEQIHSEAIVASVKLAQELLAAANQSRLVLLSVIEDRIQAEEALRESEIRFRSLFENMLNGLAYCRMLFDQEHPQDFIYLDVNQAFETLTGLKDVVGKKASEVIPGVRESDPGLLEAYGRVALTGIPAIFEIYVEALNMWFSISVYSPRKEYFVAIFDVITERKRAEEALQAYSVKLEDMVVTRTRELREAQAQLVRREKLAVLGQMSGAIAHELRQPLAVISNAVYFLQAAQPDAAPVIREYLGLVDAEVQTADHIITDLLSFAHARTAEQEPADLAGLVDQALARNPAPKGIAVQIALPPDLPPVYVDPRQMGQVLNNLVTNAYQAMPRGGQVALTAAPAATGFVSLAVADTGDGIAPENLPKLFEPLFTTKTKGIGLGLTITKMLVEANGGTVAVMSQAGKGSTFTLCLPMITAGAEPESADSTGAAGMKD